jgi:hypothetical protein
VPGTSLKVQVLDKALLKALGFYWHKRFDRVINGDTRCDVLEVCWGCEVSSQCPDKKSGRAYLGVLVPCI